MKLSDMGPEENWMIGKSYYGYTDEVKEDVKKLLNSELILYEDCVSLKTVFDYIKNYRLRNVILTDREIYKLEVQAERDEKYREKTWEEIDHALDWRNYYDNAIVSRNKKAVNSGFYVEMRLSKIRISFYDMFHQRLNCLFQYLILDEPNEYFDEKIYDKKANKKAKEKEKILRNTYVRIVDCPRFMREDITKIREKELNEYEEKKNKCLLKSLFKK